MDIERLIPVIAISILPIVLAITVHEAAHGYAAKHFGDQTAWREGRVSLNPARHIDWWGTVALPILLLLLSGNKFLFGYAKPVPVNFGRLRNPKRDMLWVAAAGPGVNFIMAVLWAALLKLALVLPDNSYTIPLAEMSNIGVEINIMLMVLNLLPLPPLDGGRIAVSLLPYPAAMKFARLEPWGFPIILLLLFTGVLSAILMPLADGVRGLLDALFNIY